MKIRYLGHSAFCIKTGKSTILIDPFFEKKDHPEIKPTHVVITHAHSDHIGNAPDYLAEKVTLISFFEICRLLAQEQPNIKISAHNIGGFVNYGDFQLKFVHAAHSSSFDGITSNGVAGGVVIKANGKCLYHAGDTGLFGDMALIGKQHSITVALLPIGSRFTMDIDDAIFAVNLIKPKYAVPMHYNTFSEVSVDPSEFIHRLPGGVAGHIFKIGEERDF